MKPKQNGYHWANNLSIDIYVYASLGLIMFYDKKEMKKFYEM